MECGGEGNEQILRYRDTETEEADGEAPYLRLASISLSCACSLAFCSAWPVAIADTPTTIASNAENRLSNAVEGTPVATSMPSISTAPPGGELMCRLEVDSSM
jgi:hypothetical protein